MRLQYELTFGDFVAAQALHAKRSEWPYLRYVEARYLCPVAGLCLLLFCLTDHRPLATQAWEVGLAVYFLSIPLIVHMSYKRHFRRTKCTDEESSLDFGQEAIRCQGPHSKSELEWEAVRSFSEGDKMLLLYLAPGKFLCIPKRVCSSPQLEELRAMLKAKTVTAS
jgi:YcxB-like protein